jgi:hypothetical protein
MSRERIMSGLGGGYGAMVALVMALGLATPALAAVDCTVVTSTASLNLTSDSDGDGFTDFQECTGITLAGGAAVNSCITTDGQQPERSTCLHPDAKDLFVIYATASTGSLLRGGDQRTEIREPFKPFSAYGVTFAGLSALGVTIHQVETTDVGADRTVTDLPTEVPNPLLSPQKAVRITEDLDTTGSTLGYCQYGTPNGLGSCAIYTQRILNFINSACAGLTIVTASGSASDAYSAFRAYAAHTILHEAGHTLGGLTASYNSRYGGYHYSAGTIMEQYVVVTTKGGKCKFAVSPNWNLSLDPPAVKLK